MITRACTFTTGRMSASAPGFRRCCGAEAELAEPNPTITASPAVSALVNAAILGRAEQRATALSRRGEPRAGP